MDNHQKDDSDAQKIIDHVLDKVLGSFNFGTLSSF